MNVHWAASSVSPRHLGGGAWNLGGGLEAAACNLRQGNPGLPVGSSLPTEDVDSFRALIPGMKQEKTVPGLLGFRGPMGRGGRDLMRVRAEPDAREELEACRLHW